MVLSKSLLGNQAPLLNCMSMMLSFERRRVTIYNPNKSFPSNHYTSRPSNIRGSIAIYQEHEYKGRGLFTLGERNLALVDFAEIVTRIGHEPDPV